MYTETCVHTDVDFPFKNIDLNNLVLHTRNIKTFYNGITRSFNKNMRTIISDKIYYRVIPTFTYNYK